MNKLILIFLILSHNIYGQNSTVKGVVTYFFNQNYGLKPDIGAEITFVENKDMEKFKDDYNKCNRKALTIEKYKLENNLTIVKSDLDKLSWSTKSKVERAYKAKVDSVKKLMSDNSMELLKSEVCESLVIEDYKKANKNHYRTSVDGAGNYSIKIPNGKYYIIITSKGRGYSIIDSIEVIDGRELNFSHDFDLVGYSGLLYLK